MEQIAAEVVHVCPGRRIRVAVDGVDGAGKTHFADELAEALAPSGRQVVRASADDFLSSRRIRYRRGRGSSTGFFLDSYDYATLQRARLHPFGPGGTGRFRRRAFDHRSDTPIDAAEEQAASDAVLVLDGLFLHRDELRALWDYSVFLEVYFAVSVGRCAQRDPQSLSPDVHAPSNRRYVEGQRLYLSRCHPRERATRVIDNNLLASPRLLA